MKILHALHFQKKNNGKNYAKFKEALVREKTDLLELKHVQNIRLRKLIIHAYRNVPFYRELFMKHNIRPSDIKSKSDLHKIPLIEKGMLKKAGSYAYANNINPERRFEAVSSGSTGSPFKMYSDRDAFLEEYSAWLRQLSVMGYEPGDRIFKIRAHDNRKYTPLSKIFSAQRFLSSDITEADPKKAMMMIKRFRPQFIESYPTTLLHVAKYFIQNNETHPMKGILAIGFPITEIDKELLRSVFKCPVMQDYGGSEAMGIAYQCGVNQHYHIDITRYVVEILKDNKQVQKEEEGEIVVTNLTNYVMPFIRYRLMDNATAGSTDCSCGRSFPYVKSLSGRIVNDIITPKGKLIRGGRLLGFFTSHASRVDRFQLLKKDGYSYDVLIVASKGVKKDELKSVEKKFLSRFDAGIEWNFKYVRKIPLSASGKMVMIKNA